MTTISRFYCVCVFNVVGLGCNFKSKTEDFRIWNQRVHLRLEGVGMTQRENLVLMWTVNRGLYVCFKYLKEIVINLKASYYRTLKALQYWNTTFLWTNQNRIQPPSRLHSCSLLRTKMTCMRHSLLKEKSYNFRWH